MENNAYKLLTASIILPVSLMAVACGDKDDPITAENVTVEQCEELFPEETDDAASADGGSEGGGLEGDYDDDGDVDEDDEAIEARCDELLSEDDSAE